MPKTKEEMIEEILGESRKTYNSASIYHCENNAFFGAKTRAEWKAEIAAQNPYSVGRSGGVTIALFALAATGKYTFDDLMDNDKLRAEKAEMYEKVFSYTNDPTPENQEWIARQIYEGRKATSAMIDAEAAKVDFSRTDLMEDPHFCKMLQMSFHQFDAWQEMKHCKEEITALAKEELPEISSYDDLRDWWSRQDSPLLMIHSALNLQERNVGDMEGAPYPSGYVASIADSAVQINSVLRDLAQIQKSGTDKPFSLWMDDQKKFDYMVKNSAASANYMRQLQFIDQEPELAVPVAKLIINSDLMKDVTVSLDPAAEVIVDGIPTPKEIKKAVADAQKKEAKAKETAPSEPQVKSLADTYTAADVISGQNFGASMLYGMLGDVLTPEQQNSIYKKISVVDAMENQAPEDVAKAYGPEFSNGGPDAEKPLRQPTQEAVKRSDLAHGYYERYNSEIFEKPLALYKEGMDELLQAVEQKALTGKFRTASEQNYFYQMKGYLEDMAAGSFSEKIKSDPVYEQSFSLVEAISKSEVSYELDPETGSFQPDLSGITNTASNIGKADRYKVMESMSQAKHTSDLMEEHLSGGNVTRGEIMGAYTDLVEKAKKGTKLGKYDLEYLKMQGVIENATELSGIRGNNRELLSASAARVQLLKAGYPAADLDAAGLFAYTMRNVAADVKDLNQQIQSAQKAGAEQNEAKLAELKTRHAEKVKLLNGMVDVWHETVNAKNLTQESRKENLDKMAASLKSLPEEYRRSKVSELAQTKLEERSKAPLSDAEKALFAGSFSEMYKLLDGTDSKLMHSSAQFKNMKKQLSELAKCEKQYDEKNPESVEAYKSQALATARGVREYLQYKTRQMDGPVRGHKRSDAEAKRVAMADAIMDGLNRKMLPGSKEPLLPERVNAVEYPSGTDRVLDGIDKDKLPKGYDSYIRLHTGRGVMNGTPEQMKEDMANTLAATFLQKKKVPFDVKKIHACAKQFSKQFDVMFADEALLRKGLQNPESVEGFMREQRRKLYGLNDSESAYYDYTEKMRALYMDLPEPNNEDDAYRALFDKVKRAAHLPFNPNGVNQERLADEIARGNYEITLLAKNYIQGRETDLGAFGKAALSCIVSISAPEAGTNLSWEKTGEYIAGVNKIRDKDKNISSLYMKEYNVQPFRGFLTKTERFPSKEGMQEVADQINGIRRSKPAPDLTPLGKTAQKPTTVQSAEAGQTAAQAGNQSAKPVSSQTVKPAEKPKVGRTL